MKKIFPLLLLLVFFSDCEKWNLEKEDFLQVTTGQVMPINVSGAAVESQVEGISNNVITQHGHVWSTITTEPTLGFNEGTAEEGGRDTDGSFTSDIADLKVNTTYNIRAFAQTKNLVSYGNTQIFTTGNVSIITDSLEYHSGRQAKAFGHLCCLDFGITIDQHGFCWSSENNNPTIEDDPFVNLGIPEADGSFSGALTDLKDNTTYYYRSYVVTDFGSEIIYGEVKTWDAQLINIWKRKANFPGEGEVDIFLPAFSYNGQGYVHIDNRLWKYDPIEDSWSAGPQKAGPLLYTSATFVIGDYAYFMIGSTGPVVPDNRCWRYDLINETWEDLDPFDGPSRISPIGFTFGNGKGYAGIGNSTMDDYALPDLWEYDPVNDEWTPLEDFPGMTNGIALISFVAGAKAYLGGGGGAGLDNFYSYDRDTDSWTLKSGLPGGQTFETVSFTIDQRGYMGTGESNGNLFSRSFWSYDPAADTWTSVADFGGAGRFGAFSFSIGNKGYVGGGVSSVALYMDLWEYKASQE